MNPLKRRIGTLNYTSAGNPSTLELPRQYNYRKLLCRLAGTSTVSGGSANGSVHTYAAYRAISRIEIIANGRDTVWSVAPEAIAVMNTLDYGTPPSFLNPVDGSAAAKTFNAFFIIDLALVRAVRPIDTLFPSAGLGTLSLKVTWGAGNSMFTGSYDRSNVIDTTTSLAIQSFEELGEIPAGVGVNKVYTIDETITAANTDQRIKIPVSNVYRGFLVHSKSDEVPVDTMIDGIRVESGVEVFQNWLSNDELLDYDKLTKGLTTRLVGYHQLDWLDSDGFMSEALDARRLSELSLVFNIALPSGTTRKLLIYPQEIILPGR